jgi:hypothetical protein
MPRYIIERSFTDGLAIPIDDRGAEMCRLVAFNNAEDNVTWLHSYVSDDGKKTFLHMKHRRLKLFGELRDETIYPSIASRRFGFSTLIFIAK